MSYEMQLTCAVNENVYASIYVYVFYVKFEFQWYDLVGKPYWRQL